MRRRATVRRDRRSRMRLQAGVSDCYGREGVPRRKMARGLNSATVSARFRHRLRLLFVSQYVARHVPQYVPQCVPQYVPQYVPQHVKRVVLQPVKLRPERLDAKLRQKAHRATVATACDRFTSQPIVTTGVARRSYSNSDRDSTCAPCDSTCDRLCDSTFHSPCHSTCHRLCHTTPHHTDQLIHIRGQCLKTCSEYP